MNAGTDVLTYRLNTASAAQIAEHLRACSHLFNPPLHEKVDIDAYAAKMSAHAVRFEAWDGAVAAGLVCAYFNDPEKRQGFITNVSTLGSHAGRGIGSALLQQCIDYGTALGFNAIHLEVHPDSLPAIRLYQKFGFLILEERPQAFIMSRSLDLN